MSADNDVIDRIDALVDEQLEQYPNRTGYDFNAGIEHCRCGFEWHGLPSGGCPGSAVEGPIDRRWDRFRPRVIAGLPTFADIDTAAWVETVRLTAQQLAALAGIPDISGCWETSTSGIEPYGNITPRRPDVEYTIVQQRPTFVEVFAGGRAPGETREEARTNGPNRGRPPVPRPSTTPPMWANNPGRTRRTRNRAVHARTPLV